MNTSRSFDQAAEMYDKTRPLIDVTTETGMRSIMDAAGAGARFLEVGAGTGRISIPLLERGVDLIGCDLSAKMLRRQLEKYPAARLARADAAYLPFSSGHFGAILAVHVMHLIGPWQEALREFKRVLQPGGVFLIVSTNESVGRSLHGEVRDHWRGWLRSHGFEIRHPGAQNEEEVRAELRSMGARLREVEVVRFPHAYTLRAELDRYQNRISSETWSVPDELYQASLVDLHRWAAQTFDDLEREIEETNRFVFDVAVFDAV